MYNFTMTKDRKENIIENCNFNDFEKRLFEELTTTRKRKDVYDKFEISQASIDRHIAKLAKRIDDYENGKVSNTHKLYMHIFPNKKIYIGVCVCCEERWNNGSGYAYNKEMYDDINKYGWDKIEHVILLESTNTELIYKLESNLIKALKTYKDGYNTRYRGK